MDKVPKKGEGSKGKIVVEWVDKDSKMNLHNFSSA